MSIIEASVGELEAALDAGALLFDVRETNEYEDGHVRGAIHVPLGTVADNVEAFRPTGGDEAVYVICRSGARSMRACEFLAGHGVEAVNVAGGTMDWLASGRSVVVGNLPL
ncbi:MAG TPA: rhodanese-like domain-containing protein [Ilumatobacteraceae bacterium]|nr:rhodanese-like domain-containing protein [Ilumatobacteraceae bacterium]HRB03242.1 rhodanese-like domain-containing protein [Ilumatobacteraceae bacterium]